MDIHEKTIHADLLLAGITHLVTVLVADKIHQHATIHSKLKAFDCVIFPIHNVMIENTRFIYAIFSLQKSPGNLAVPGHLMLQYDVLEVHTKLYMMICQSVITR